MVKMSLKKDQIHTVPLLRGRKTTSSRKFARILRFLLVFFSGLLIFKSINGTGQLMWKSPWKDSYTASFLPFVKKSELNSKEAEKLYLDTLDNSNFARDWLYKYTEKTHLAGTNYELVEWTAKKFEEYGLKASVKTYYTYVNFPKDHGLTLLKGDKKVYTAPLKEDELPEDPATYGNNTIPTFHGYSANGNITARFFYANYGRKGDFAKLAEEGVDMKGKIAIVRYGEIYRGLKVKFAQESGCAGVLIYSDPGDDGEFIPENGYKQYPNGPARHESSVQRGSVLYLSSAPGDPTTPGYSSNSPDVERKDPHHAIPKIPSLPISYREVKPILESLNETGLKSSALGSDWTGKLTGYDYSVGPSPEKLQLNLYNEQAYNITPIWNVIGEIPGVINDEVIIVGNHRDGWAGSAGDPNSGSATLLEIVRSLHELQKKGWKPFRRIVFASFDGEEIGLLGSTEWAEDISKELQSTVVAYLNLDSAVTGKTLILQSSPVLNDILISAAKDLDYPKGGSLWEHYKNGIFEGNIDILGSGSDYTVFLEHLGIPSFDMGFASNPLTDPIYQYHSNYDSFHWIEKFADPGFVYHNLISKYLGLIILRLSDREVIQLKLNDNTLGINEYFKDVAQKFPSEWDGRSINKSVVSTASSIHPSFVNVPMNHFTSLHDVVTGELLDKIRNHDGKKGEDLKFKDLVTFINYTLKHLEKITRKFDEDANILQTKLDNFEGGFWDKFKLYVSLKKTNLKSKFVERLFLHEDGLNGRSWFKHIVFASGRYTGYAGQSLPGIREAVEDNDFEDTVKWLIVLSKTLINVIVQLKV